MKQYFIVTDVHSFYSKMIKALEVAGYDKDNPEHIFVSLGDLFDRGDESYEMLMFVNSIPGDRKILVRGNHEDCLEDALVRHSFRTYDYHNQTDKTIKDWYKREHPDENLDNVPTFDICEWAMKWEPYKQYISELEEYAVIDNYVFVHGWLPFWITDFYQLELADRADWRDARWTNGMKSWHNGHKMKNYTVVCGHWHTSYGNSKYHYHGVQFLQEGADYGAFGIEPYEDFDPFVDNGIIALDACTAYSGQVNVMKVNGGSNLAEFAKYVETEQV